MKELILQIQVLDRALDTFPDSSKRGLLKGSIDYCSIALEKKVLEGCDDTILLSAATTLYKKARTILLENKYEKLDFDEDVYDIYFEGFQEFCSKCNILPILDNLTLREVLKINRAYEALELEEN